MRFRLLKLEHSAAAQRGSYLLESLIAILIFAIGILGLVGLLGSSIRVTNDARYRSEAANLANAMISEMWTNSPAPGQLDLDYCAGCTRLASWQTKALALLPSPTPTPITVDLTQPSLSPESRTVVVTIVWQMPGETEVHRQMMTAQIGKNQNATWP